MPELQSPPATAAAPEAARPVDATPAPSAIYEALGQQKSVLSEQLSVLTDQRADLVRELQSSQSPLSGASRSGLEARVATLDKTIAGVDAQMAITDAKIAAAAAVPGAVVPRPPIVRSGPPDEVYVLTGLFMIIVLLPLTIAYARRIWRRSAAVVTSIPAELMARIQRIEQTVETSAIEIERIGEGQRFITKLFGEERLPALSSRSETAAPSK